MAKRDWRKKKKKAGFDYTLFFLSTALSLFGLVMIYNASSVEAFEVFQDKYYYLKNQALWAAIGILIMIVISKIDYRLFKKIAAPLFFVNIFLLVLVLIPGIATKIKGARRWISLGFVVFQPAELAKLTFTIYLATWLLERRRFIHFLALVFLFSFLIILEPDLGTLVVIISNAFLIYFIAGASFFKLVLLLGTAVLAVLLMIFKSPYRRERLVTFFNPAKDPLGSSYHIRQVLISLGAGGIFGIGLGQSRQKYQFLPEATSDSIFAIIGEETGFLGAGLVVFIFLFIVLRGIKIAQNTDNKFGKLLALGISGWIGIQTMVNLGAMVALIPLTGLPLPFLSYGGSSLIVTLASIGILLSISR